MPAIRTRLAATIAIAIAIVAVPTGQSADARRTAVVVPMRARVPASILLLRRSDVPGLVTNPHAVLGLSLWESAEREAAARGLLRETGWRSAARRTFGQAPPSLYGVLVIESRVLVFSRVSGARRALPLLLPAGLRRVRGQLPLAGGASMYAHEDTVSGVSELALATQFRQRNVISRVMIVGTPGIITWTHLLATARRQAARVAEGLATQKAVPR